MLRRDPAQPARDDERVDPRERATAPAGPPLPQSIRPQPRRGGVGPTSAPHVLALQASAGNAALCRALAGGQLAVSPASGPLLMRDISAPADPASAKQRADELISDFERQATDYQSATKDWQMANYIDFLTRTSSNPSVSWGNSTAFGIFAEALSSASGIAVIKYMDPRMKPSGPIVGAALARGAAAGFVLGVLVEYGVTFLLDKLTGKSDAEARAVAKAVAANNQLIQAQLVHLMAAETAAKTAIRGTADRLKAELAAAAQDTEAIYAIQREAWESANALRKVVHGDRSLLQGMLREWVLEHAGDEDEANTETSGSQWKQARAQTFGKGRSLDSHPEIFAYQARNHWAGIGLAGADLATPMIKEAEAAGSKGADQVMKSWDGKRFEFTTTKKPDAFISMVRKHAERVPTDDTKAAIKEGRFKLVAKLDLHEYNGAVYVDTFDCTLSLLGPSNTEWWSVGTGRSLGSGVYLASKARESTIDFSVDPDDD